VRFKNSPVLIEDIPVRRINHIACGGNHSFLCSDEGQVFSWGEGKHGALGLGTLQDRFKPSKIQIPNDARIAKVDCGLEHSIMLEVSGRVYASGSNKKGQLGLG
jgi:alpha-tubulin suppressor-like RCC1 family protein